MYSEYVIKRSEGSYHIKLRSIISQELVYKLENTSPEILSGSIIPTTILGPIPQHKPVVARLETQSDNGPLFRAPPVGICQYV